MTFVIYGKFVTKINNLSKKDKIKLGKNIGSKRIKASTNLGLSCPIRFWTEKPTLECEMNIHHLLVSQFFTHFVRNTSNSIFPNPPLAY